VEARKNNRLCTGIRFFVLSSSCDYSSTIDNQEEENEEAKQKTKNGFTACCHAMEGYRTEVEGERNDNQPRGWSYVLHGVMYVVRWW